MSSISRDEARTLVKGISASHGFVDYEHWQAMGEWDMDRKRIFERAFLAKDNLIGSAVITLAKNLYSSNARFLFELLQNCDDNHYMKAEKQRTSPIVVFEVYPNRIILECNEDGFTKRNLSAICNIGRSSKSGTQVYIGEKGIGFKSVFKVAYKAVIQSGPFCFSFTHRKGDSGMGMISPQWEEKLPPGKQDRTRITLWLHEDDPGDVSVSISEQFEAIHEEMLLFMRKIKTIVVKTYADDQRLKHSSTYSRRNGLGRVVSTERLRREGNSESRTTKHFHLTTYTATGLPKSENREYNNEALESESYTQSDIVLAFPLNERSEPLLGNQWLFSFLPVTQTGFKFIIQADFVTSASRESIETTSSRNRVLAQRIPDAFTTAVLQMCEHKTLQYQWMRYIPSIYSEHASDSFWSTVVDGIKKSLEETPVLRPASLGSLRLIHEMRMHTQMQLDQSGQPLFADIYPEKYLSPEYALADLTILEAYGLRYMYMNETLTRLSHDLQSEGSRIRSYEDEAWHTRVAKFLQFPFEKEWHSLIQELKSMKILPLRDGSWTSIEEGTVYYADLNKLTIPGNLRLRTIKTSASDNTDRRKLFDFLGVQRASVDLVREQICQKYRWPGPLFLTCRESLDDLHFLYLTQDTVAIVEENLGVKVKTRDFDSKDPSFEDVYLTSDDSLGASHLLKPTPAGPDVDDGAPGQSVLFLHDCYLDNPPSDPPATLPKWVDWLHDSVHIRRHLRLEDNFSHDLSQVCRYVAEHRPTKFVTLLNRLWQLQSHGLRKKSTLISQLRKIKVLCRAGRFYALSATFFPTCHLENTAKRFLADGDPFRWLQLGLSSGEECQPQEWQQLASALDIGLNPSDLQFGLSLLQYLRDTATSESFGLRHSARDSNGHSRVRDLYVFVDAQVRASADGDSARKTVRNMLTDLCLIFIPADYQSGESDWVSPKRCVWTAPVRHPRRVYALDALYARTPGKTSSSSSRHSLETFFRNVGDVPQWDWKLAVDELEAHREGDADFDCILGLYKWLSKNSKRKSDAENIRHAFEARGLVYSPNKQTDWHKSSDCLWETATPIPGKTPINNDGDYEELESFFLDIIGVQKVTLGMLYDKLSNPRLDIALDELKGDLLEFSALLAKEDWDSFDSCRMCKNRIFPVRRPDGSIDLFNSDDDFAIIDRAPLAASFRDKALLLDFDMEQVRGLEYFIRWADLDDRYLSTSVREIAVPDRTSLRPISEPERQIRKKAGALLSIAKHFYSPRIANGYDEFYQTLRNCDTFETGKITTTLLLHQGDTEPIKHEKNNGVALFIDGSSENMKVFVPKRIADREACFQSKLPRHLFEWIMTDPETNIREPCVDNVAELLKENGIRAVQAVLGSRTCALKDILLEFGIPDVDAAYVDDVDEVDDADDNNDGHGDQESMLDNGIHEVQNLVERPQAYIDDRQGLNALPDPDSSNTEDEPVPTPAVSITSGSLAEAESIVASAVSRRANMRANSASIHPIDYHPLVPAPEASPDLATLRTTPYRRLLETLVNRAARLEFPSIGAFDMSELRRGLPGQPGEDPVNGLPFLRPFGIRERNNMVGAAGELFVFELLRHVEPSLPGFDISNWKSNIRGYAAAHPEFAAISSWGGSETADITYSDQTGTFTSFLADKGYLDSYDIERLRRAKPLYYLEVKSTPYDFSTSFFMTGSQFKRMQECSQSVPGQEGNLNRVYIILRVFKMGTDSASVRLLIDPEGMRRRGELNFEAESWRVHPSTE